MLFDYLNFNGLKKYNSKLIEKILNLFKEVLQNYIPIINYDELDSIVEDGIYLVKEQIQYGDGSSAVIYSILYKESLNNAFDVQTLLRYEGRRYRLKLKTEESYLGWNTERFVIVDSKGDLEITNLNIATKDNITDLQTLIDAINSVLQQTNS